MTSPARARAAWTLADADETYGISGWGLGLFEAGAEGSLQVRTEHGPIDLHQLAGDLAERGIDLPVLVRFPDVLEARVSDLAGSFRRAMEANAYRGSFRGVFPVKVNQQRHVIEDLVRLFRPHHMGLESGSKAELMVAIAHLDDPDALVICNGYKDAEYIDMALLSRTVGRNTTIVVEQPTELELIVQRAEHLGVVPSLGLRTRLNSSGAGRWQASSGDSAKFGLGPRELLAAVRELRDLGGLDWLRLLHFHLGSQIPALHLLRDAVREAARTYVELARLGAPMGILDVGGGVGIDYDGAQSPDRESSIDYGLREYCAAVVEVVAEVCNAAGVPHPILVTESGRALVAPASVLIVPVLEVAHRSEEVDEELFDVDSVEVSALREILAELSGSSDAISVWSEVDLIRGGVNLLYARGAASLEEKAAVDQLSWSIARRLHRLAGGVLPEELVELEHALADTYFCNFSVFQSLPDSWAIDQLFPVVPLHRLDEAPTRRATLADLTCDSDGKVDRFTGPEGPRPSLPLHEPNGVPYLLGVFLVGAYQETLGDLHNLFGDTHAVHVRGAATARGYRVESFVEGDRCDEVLRYMQFDPDALFDRVRGAVERAVDRGLALRDGKRLIRAYREGLGGYTYLGGGEL